MRRNAAAALACLIVCCTCDFVWLGLVARDFYASRLGALVRTDPGWVPAVLFYLLYACGLVVFCVQPSLATGSGRASLGRGAFFGLVAYGTYDLTNLATLKGWPLAVSLADMAWGVFVGGLAALAGYAAASAVPRQAPR